MNKLWIDPPSGWRYGFPKIWDPQQEPDLQVWLIQSGYPEHEVKFGLQYYRQWVADAVQPEPVDAAELESDVPIIGEEFEQKRSLFEGLDSVRDVFKQWEDDFAKERLDFWNSLTQDQQLLAFCEVVSRLVQGELVDKRSYRGVLYDNFEFGIESYVMAQVSGFLYLHNAIDRK
jgi:hypothetical protein